MNNKYRLLQSTRTHLLQRQFLAVLAVAIFAVPVVTNAQETTSSIRGKVLDSDGNAAVAASIVVEDLRTEVQRTYLTNSSGVFLATRLPAGGPYKVTVNGTKSVLIPTIVLADTYALTINMQSEAAIEEILVLGTTAKIMNVAAGPSSVFTQFEMQSAVSFNRDIVDVYAVDPRLNIDNSSRGFAINCMGMHPRFNSVTLDGVSMNDRFGLNDSGYATATGMPFPYDAIEQVAIELAPFDVTYGGFSACNINAVTKTGTNQWQAGVFYEVTNDSLHGDTIKDTTITTPGYDNSTYGFSVGGPLVKDKLFVFAAYEFDDRVRFIAQGYDNSGNGTERDWLSQTDYDLIEQTAANTYNYDAGGQPLDGSQENEKYMIRLDWNINEDHNATLVYNYFDGFQARDSDGDNDEFEFANHFYTKGAVLETITFKIASQWTDSFSSEFFYSTSEMNDSQVTVGPKDFGDHQIDLFSGDTVYLGADDSRQANKLDTESTFLKLAGQLLVKDHVLTFGYERDSLDIFNLFVQHSNGGEWDYYGVEDRDDDGTDELNPASCDALDAAGRWADTNCWISGLDQFVLGRPSRIYYGSGGGTNVAADAGAAFTNVQNTLYFQDEIFFDNLDMTLMVGLRYEWFESSDSPTYNDAFTQANNGLRNDSTVDGLDILMPRIGVTWNIRDDLTLRGGIGLYSGGNPNVWISNSYSNDGITNVQVQWFNFDAADNVLDGSVELSRQGRPGYDVPQSLVDTVLAVTPADGATRNLVLMDPNYEQPGIWKFALGATWDMPWGGWLADFDYIHSEQDNPAQFVDISQTITGMTSVGLPIYDFTNGSDNLMLTNSSDEGSADLFSILLSNTWENGIDFSFGYSHTEAEDVSPMTSSVAVSNFDGLATNDVNNPGVGPSNYVAPNRFTFRFSYGHEFFGDNTTRFTLYGSSAEGQPQSYVMGNGGQFEGDGFFGRHLLYVPDGPTDPNVTYAAGFDQQAFFDWIADNGLKPGTQTRNAHHAPWTTRIDLRIDQEFPLFRDSTKGRLYFKVYNLGNLLNDDWGAVEDAQFFPPQIIKANVNDVTGVLEYQSFSNRSITDRQETRSFWEARFGIDIFFGQ